MATLAEIRDKAIRSGRPRYISEDRADHVAFIHADDEAAVRAAQANREVRGYRAWAEEREGFVVSVVDLRPASTDAAARFRDGVA